MTAVSHSRFLSINISVGIMNDRRLKLRKDHDPQAELPVSSFCLTLFGFDDPVLEITDLSSALTDEHIYIFFHLDYFSFVLQLLTVNQWSKRWL